ncbi:uncharacterized protein ARMOST_12673 [Armillaria ostoyae]|uniref:Uncharacterized protein n=1 Tax=Armillaria ostoyae TaxID=47428 RepID=A0A284RKL0_ARMOS|nr:uncharacterized protein ARMOST_12673 [Armillaria ostoyae]
MPTCQRVLFSNITNTDTAQSAAVSISPGFSSSPFSIISFLNGEDDPLFPVLPLLLDDPSPSLDAGFNANLNALTNFLETITPLSTTACCFLTSIDSIDCVMGMSSELTSLSMLPQYQQQLSLSKKSKQLNKCTASSPVAHSEDPVASTKACYEISSRHPLANEVSSVAIKKKLASEKREAFTEDLSQGMEEHREKLEAITVKHGKKFEEVLCVAGSASRYKGQQAVSDL